MGQYDIAERWERIKQLKREGKLPEAIALLEQEAQDQEAASRRESWDVVAPGPFKELQKLYRREGRHSDEVAILRRLRAGTPNPDPALDTLIEEATQRMEAAAATQIPLACPHCGVVLDPPPKASRNCPECREKLVVRTDPVTKAKLVLTPARAVDFDQQKKAAAARRKIMNRLSALHLGREDYEAAASDLREQFNVAEPPSGDVFWRLANNLQLHQEMNGQWLDAARTWSEMAEHLRDEGRNLNNCLEQKFKNELRYHAEATAAGSGSTAIPLVDIVVHKGCEACAVDDSRRIAILEAQEQMPLPHENCSKGFCGCGYRSVYPESAYDSDGETTASEGRRKTSLVKRLFGR